MVFPFEEKSPSPSLLPGEIPMRPPTPPQEPGEKKPKMDWYYDGQSWVYADKPPEKKPPSIEKVKEAEKIFYTYAKAENPVQNALINSLRGKYKDPNKPKSSNVYLPCAEGFKDSCGILKPHLAG